MLEAVFNTAEDDFQAAKSLNLYVKTYDRHGLLKEDRVCLLQTVIG